MKGQPLQLTVDLTLIISFTQRELKTNLHNIPYITSKILPAPPRDTT